MDRLRARLVATRPGAAAYRRTLEALPDDLTRLSGRVADLLVYPVKGLGGVRTPSATTGPQGLVLGTGLADRSVMLAFRVRDQTDHDAHALSNRLEPVLSLARARLDGASLVYEAPGVAPLRLDPGKLLPRAGTPTRVLLYHGGPVLDAVEAAEDLAAWVRDLLAAHPRRRRYAEADVIALVPLVGARRRVADKHRGGEDVDTVFSDGGHLLVASSSTLSWMNDAIGASGGRRIDMAAFRPNVVVDGLPPNAEDVVGEISVAGRDGEVRLVFASLSIRCDAVRVDVVTGDRPDKEPLAFLARERPSRDDDGRSATFAVNAVARRASEGRTLGVGDPFRVLGERP